MRKKTPTSATQHRWSQILYGLRPVADFFIENEVRTWKKTSSDG